MVIKRIDLETTSLTLEDLLAELEPDTEVLLTRGISPVARIASAKAESMIQERILGLHEGEGWMSDDFTDELPATYWLGEDA